MNTFSRETEVRGCVPGRGTTVQRQKYNNEFRQSMEDAMAMLWQEYILGGRGNLRDNVKSVKCSEREDALYSFMSWSFRCGHKTRGSGTKLTILTGPEDRRHMPCHTEHVEKTPEYLQEAENRAQENALDESCFFFFFLTEVSLGKAREETVSSLGLATFEQSQQERRPLTARHLAL